MQLQAVGLVHIAQQCFFLCDGRLLARFGDFGPLHQFGRLVAQKAPVRPQAAVAGVLFLLGPAAPALGAARGLTQPGDVLFQPFVFRAFAVVLHAFVFLPDGEIPLHHGDVTAIQYQHMVGAAVQQVSVVGNQDISPFLRQIFTQKAASSGIQMVCRLVDEQECAIVQKQAGQQDLGLLSITHCIKWAI